MFECWVVGERDPKEHRRILLNGKKDDTPDFQVPLSAECSQIKRSKSPDSGECSEAGKNSAFSSELDALKVGGRKM